MGSSTRVGFLGLGCMGRSMAANLQRAGLLQAVWNRSADKAEAFAAEQGCAVATTPEDLLRRCDVVVLCVSADQDVLAMLEAMRVGLSADKLVIDCSTVSRETALQAAALCREHGSGFVDAPVSGGTEGARLGTLTIMVGGSEPDFERALPILQAMGERIQCMGEVGAGQATKAVNQVLGAGINQAVCEALHFAEALELPVDDVVDMIGSGASGNWFINHRGKTMVRDDFTPGFKVALHHKDLVICEAMAEAAGMALPLSTATREAFERLMQRGYADSDVSALYRDTDEN